MSPPPIPVPKVSIDRVRGAPGRAGALLGQGGVVAVVVNEHGQSEPLGHHVGKGDVGQRRVHADRDLARPAVDQGGQPKAHGIHLGPCGFAGFGHRIDRHVEQGALLQPGDAALNAVMNA